MKNTSEITDLNIDLQVIFILNYLLISLIRSYSFRRKQKAIPSENRISNKEENLYVTSMEIKK